MKPTESDEKFGEALSDPNFTEPTVKDFKVEFSGSVKEYFPIWFTNTILSIATLGIYSAWVKVRTRRYFYGGAQQEVPTFAQLKGPTTKKSA